MNNIGWYSVQEIYWLSDVFDLTESAIYSLVEKQLKKMSDDIGHYVYKMTDPVKGKVNTYNVDVIEMFYSDLMSDKTLLSDYRK